MNMAKPNLTLNYTDYQNGRTDYSNITEEIWFDSTSWGPYKNLDLSNSYVCGGAYCITFEDCIFNGTTFCTFAILTECIFINCSFVGAKFHFTTFERCQFYNCNFDKATLRRSKFERCNLQGLGNIVANAFNDECYLENCSNIPDNLDKEIQILPPIGVGFQAWKKARINKEKLTFNYALDRHCIVELYIPPDARRSSALSNKCRADKAIIIGIKTIVPVEKDLQLAYSKYDSEFEYHVGETITVDNFDTNRWNECSTGIHFFLNRDEAVAYI